MYNEIIEAIRPIALQQKGKYNFAIFPLNGHVVIKVFEGCFNKYIFEVYNVEGVNKVIEKIKAGL